MRLLPAFMTRQKAPTVYVEKELGGLVAIFDDLFRDGRKATPDVIKKKLLSLSDNYNLPYKYHKGILDAINGDSIFTGYFEKNYQGLFTKREINELKKTILRGKYSGLSEKEVATNIRNTINVTKKRAQLLARTELSRLRASAQEAYYQESGIKATYEKVHHTTGDNIRPDHQAYDKQVADKDGLFHGPLGSFKFAPIPNQYNCKCVTVLRKRKKLLK